MIMPVISQTVLWIWQALTRIWRVNRWQRIKIGKGRALSCLRLPRQFICLLVATIVVSTMKRDTVDGSQVLPTETTLAWKSDKQNYIIPILEICFLYLVKIVFLEVGFACFILIYSALLYILSIHIDFLVNGRESVSHVVEFFGLF